MDEQQTFHLGLSMAGAVSAGAYTAGVIDYLIETLENWEKAKQDAPDKTPPHKVVIDVMSGASAGGIVTALTAAMLKNEFEHVRKLGNNTPNNKLYNAWVNDIDVEPLLYTGKDDDIAAKGVVPSLLNSTVIDQIAEKHFNFDSNPPVPRPYLSDNLEIFLTISNLRGIPYAIEFGSNKKLEMLLHRDFMHFKYTSSNGKNEEAIPLGNEFDENWEVLRASAKATGAFPLMLAPRLTSRSKKLIDVRPYKLPNEAIDVNNTACNRFGEIEPFWIPSIKEDENYVFDCLNVDGGFFHNEPFEFALNCLAKRTNKTSLPSAAEKVHSAAILIDPFPNKISAYQYKYQPKDDLPNVVASIYSSLRSQLIFKIEDIHLANQLDVYNRFMILPSRKNSDHKNTPLASGSLGGFGGFLDRRFRDVDYQLGRKNCQDFLQYHFVIPISADNPLFRGWTDAMKEHYQIERRSDGKLCLPIIPDMNFGNEAFKLEEPPYPQYTNDEWKKRRRKLKKSFKKRLTKVLKNVTKSEKQPNFIIRVGGILKFIFVYGLAFLDIRSKTLKVIMDRIEKELECSKILK